MNMKKFKLIYATALVLSMLFACTSSDERRPEGGSWNTSSIEGFEVTPINGGAFITYDIANEPEILYVMAEYERNGKIYTEKSSVHKNEMTIEGFGNTDLVKAKLYKVNRLEQRSKPLEVEFVPLDPLVDVASRSLKIVPGFGGIVASWKNIATTEFGVRLMTLNKDNVLETNSMYFSSIPEEKRSFRGFEPKEQTFAIAFEDKWGNSSDTTWLKTSPFFETMVPKPYADFRASIPYDNLSTLSGRNINVLWDNIVNTASHGWLTQPGNSGLSMTIDLKKVVKLSRIVIHGYHVNSVYGQANVTQFEAYGVKKMDFDKLGDRPYWLDETSVRNDAIVGVSNTTVLPNTTFKNEWEYLGWHAIPRYDKTVPPDPAAQAALAIDGTEYEMPLDAGPVRYVRIFVREVTGTMPPPANNYWSMGEITFYGDDTVPQN